MERQQFYDFINWHQRELLDYGCEITYHSPTFDWLVVCYLGCTHKEIPPAYAMVSKRPFILIFQSGIYAKIDSSS
ncbi:MAG: hypothetical protein A2030_01600 [Chloroflexi bacterium RBG_19FT_COMBO_50_10]|nr:MAG: hypothetical protein A2030_01600 [Chloroflexi bacterium RBG_19FT_COMBO_50_10]